MTIKRNFIFDADDEKINGDCEAYEVFGVGSDRADYLLSAFGNFVRKERAQGVRVTNKVAAFAEFVKAELLTGCDVAFLCYIGFIAVEGTDNAIAEVLSDPMKAMAFMANYSGE